MARKKLPIPTRKTTETSKSPDDGGRKLPPSSRVLLVTLQKIPKTPKGKHSEGAGKKGGDRSQGSFSIIGKTTMKLINNLLRGKGGGNGR